MPSAKAPSRSTGNIVFTIGLVSLGLSTFAATEDSAVRRSMYVRCEVKGEDGKPKTDDAGNQVYEYHKVGVTNYDQITMQNVDKDKILKMFECPDGTLVEITDDEIERLLTKDDQEAKLVGFLPYEEFARSYVVNGMYYARPQEITVGSGKKKQKARPYDKPFSLFCQAMERKGCVMLLSFVKGNRTNYAALLSDGRMFTLKYDDEVREALPINTVDVSEHELSLGATLIDQFTLSEAPVFLDEDSAVVTEYAVTKQAGRVEIDLTKKAGDEEVVATETPDLMAVLQASLDAAKVNA